MHLLVLLLYVTLQRHAPLPADDALPASAPTKTQEIHPTKNQPTKLPAVDDKPDMTERLEATIEARECERALCPPAFIALPSLHGAAGLMGAAWAGGADEE